MRSKLSAFAANLAESGWLAALAVVPVFFNPHGVRIFEEDKVQLLRSLALLIGCALVVWQSEQGRAGGDQLAWWRTPLVRPALALAAVYVASSVTSIQPWVSWFGAFIRSQGTYTWLSYMVVFLALVLLLRERGQIERVVTVILLASVAPAAYGVCQHHGLDPIRWTEGSADRVVGTAGNPIFFAAYLIMVVPLTLVRCIEQAAAVSRRRGSAASDRRAAALLLGAYVLLLTLQLLAIVYTQSRGPFLGLGAGLTCFAVVAASRRSRRATLAAIGVVAAAAVLLVTFNLPASPLAPWRSLPLVGRLGKLLEVRHGTGKVRVLVWEATTRLLAAAPKRLPLGYGPETMFVAFTPFYPPELAHIERRGVTPDRAHNDSFDALITIGVTGFIAGLIVYGALFMHALGWLGLATGTRQRASALACLLAGAGLGVIVPLLADGGLRFAGIGVPVGIVVGFLGYVLARAIVVAPGARQSAPGDLLLVGLVSAIVAHFVEVHFGIAIAVTRLYFWTYAALIVAIGARRVAAGAEMTAAGSPLLGGRLATVSPTVGLLLALVTYDFYTARLDLVAHAPLLGATLGGTWLVGACLIGTDSSQARDRTSAVLAYTATSVGLWLAFFALYRSWAHWRPVTTEIDPAVILMVGERVAQRVSLLYGFVLGLVLLQSFIQTMRQRPLPAVWVQRPLRAAWLYPALIVLSAYAAVATNLRPAHADVLAKQATSYERRRRPDAAAHLYAAARRLQPREDWYTIGLGRALTAHARRNLGDDPVARERVLAQAQQALEEGWRLNPLNPDHPRNLAKLHREWSVLREGDERTLHFEQADRDYAAAAELAPHNAALLNEWATMQLEHAQPTRALAILDRASVIDQRYTTTFWLRANARVALGQREEALREFDRALAIDATLLAAWSGKALALAELGRIDEAIETNRRALAVEPEDFLTHRNLAVLHQRAGHTSEAVAAAREALARAKKPEERVQLEEFIAELEEEQ